MREIKFRAWMNGEMHKDIVLVWDYPKHLDTGAPLNAGIKNFIRFGEGKHILMQYTGLKDQKGKEIYEGDVVQLPNEKVKPYVIEWEEDVDNEYGGEWVGFDRGCVRGEVIGDIYTTPELLDEKGEGR